MNKVKTPLLFCTLLSVLHINHAVDLTYYLEEGNSPGTVVGDIAADTHLPEQVPLQDRKLIRYSLLQQSLVEGMQLFRVSKTTGKLYTAQIVDAETLCRPNSECSQILKVAVRRNEAFMKILKIKVVFQDVNDHQPEFPVKEVKIKFSEDDSKGVRRSIPNAIDKDVGPLNSQITYELKKNLDDPFMLSVSKSLDGTSDLSINLEKRLDREVRDSYMVQVIAKDGGSPLQQSVLDVHISVTDVNDNPPVFSQNVYNVSIKNEHDVVTPVAILYARDLDSDENGRITYQFSSKTSDVAQSYFKVNKVTGEVFLQKRIPNQQKLKYKLYVKATDGGSPPLSSIAMVLVNVINQQNNAPTIDVNFVSGSNRKKATISEDIKVGSFIAYVVITDHDAGPNGDVSCDLYHEKFQLQSLGTKEYKVVVKNSLDRETADHHDLTIRCQDKGSPPLHSDTRFSIEIMDVNDVRPQLFKDTYKFWVYENENPKTRVGSINATDPDLGPGGKLTYSLLTNKRNFLPFQISDNGIISTVMSLDHEFQDVYKFQVLVNDNGIPGLNSTVNVSVEVRDENDNAPYFTFPSVNPFTFDVEYYPHHSNNITVLKAFDGDSRENAFLKYEIVTGNDKQLFNINHYTGLLSFTREISVQDSGMYELEFSVKDSGTPSLSATTAMVLMLTVSNKTTEVLNTVHPQPADKIHLYLMIVLVLVAVTLSVPLTAGVSICIIRCKQRKTAAQRAALSASCKCVNEHSHYVCPSMQATYWSSTPATPTTDQDMTRTSSSSRARRGLYPEENIGYQQKGSAFGMKGQSASEIIYQVSVSIAIFFLFLFLFHLCSW